MTPDSDDLVCALAIEPAELEALEAGALPADTARRLDAHVAECAACTAELAWLRAEAELMARRSRTEREPDLDRIWAEVERRVSTPPTRATPSKSAQRRRSILQAATMGAAAAVFMLAFWRGAPLTVPSGSLFAPSSSGASGTSTSGKPSARDPLATVRGAERQYAEAAAELEKRWAAERARLDPTTLARVEADLTRSRSELDAARRLAGDDIDARVELLSTYADYVHSLHALIVELDSPDSEVN